MYMYISNVVFLVLYSLSLFRPSSFCQMYIRQRMNHVSCRELVVRLSLSFFLLSFFFFFFFVFSPLISHIYLREEHPVK
ncbi:hypothetical protein M752DRAFT_111286 [Aspergillus phoenicis ATCC 13157]|uniref:Uncharacterized protein n=1 Tax=Aspergillus phoenicis ATCC 13157 TaxID=1353007 RepID=A0A370P4H4_ASPPH|nr:hypothetical protein M752DRAFT_111286 [Aspergillus phoenicis ATCC 13157]